MTSLHFSTLQESQIQIEVETVSGGVKTEAAKATWTAKRVGLHLHRNLSTIMVDLSECFHQRRLKIVPLLLSRVLVQLSRNQREENWGQ
jgi:hypothetical protein